MKFDSFVQELRIVGKDPRQSARRIMALHLTLPAAWAALLLVAVVAAVLGYLGFLVSGMASDPAMQMLFGSPLQSALIQAVLQAVTAVLLFLLGQYFGGTGSFADAVALTAWSGVPLIALQLLQLVVMLIAPTVADILGLVAVVLSFALITLFACELHGFTRTLLVLGGVIATAVAIGFGFILFIATLGAMVPNV